MEHQGNGWIVFQSNNGAYFYYNLITGESSRTLVSQEPNRSEPTHHANAQYNPLYTTSSRPHQQTTYDPNQTNQCLTYNQPWFGNNNGSFREHDPRTTNQSMQTEPRLWNQDMATQADDDIELRLPYTSIPLCKTFPNTNPPAVMTDEATVRATPNDDQVNLLDSDGRTPSSHFRCQNDEAQYEMDIDEATFGNQLSDGEPTDTLLLAPDVDTIVNESQFLSEFLASHRNARLLLPSSARRHLEALCRGASEGHPSVVRARHALQWLDSLRNEFVVWVVEDDASCVEWDLFSCCCDAANSGYVILLTDNDQMKEMSRDAQLTCMGVDEFKRQLNHHSDVTEFDSDVVDNVEWRRSDDNIENDMVEDNSIGSVSVADFCNLSLSDEEPRQMFGAQKSPVMATSSTNMECGLSPQRGEIPRSDTIESVIHENYKCFTINPANKYRNKIKQWVFVYVQTMEDCMENVLAEHFNVQTRDPVQAPQSLLQAVTCLAEVTADNNVRKVCVSLVALLHAAGNNGTVPENVGEDVFMKIVATSSLLVRILVKSLGGEASKRARGRFASLTAAICGAPAAELPPLPTPSPPPPPSPSPSPRPAPGTEFALHSVAPKGITTTNDTTAATSVVVKAESIGIDTNVLMVKFISIDKCELMTTSESPAQKLIRLYLREIRSVFMAAHQFVVTVAGESGRGNMAADRMCAVTSQAGLYRTIIRALMAGFLSVLESERGAKDTLKILMFNITPRDVRLATYDRVIAKCSELAAKLRQWLEEAQSASEQPLNIEAMLEKSDILLQIFNDY